MVDTSRRGLLRRAGGVAAAGALAGLAGCTTVDALRYRSVGPTLPSAPEADYGRFVPASHPEGVDDDVLVLDLTRFEEPDGALASLEPGLLAWSRTARDWLDIGASTPETYVGLGFSTALFVGEIDVDATEAALAAGGYEPTGTTAERIRYERPDGRVAVVSPRLVGWSGEGSAGIEAMLAAADGDRERRADADEGFASMLEAVGRRPFGWLRPDRGSGDLLGTFSVIDAADEWAYVGTGGVFAEPEAVSRDAVAGGDDGRLEPVRFVSDGRVGVAVVAERPDPPDPEAWLPVATLESERDGDDLVIRHLAGESFDADGLDLHGPAALPDAPREVDGEFAPGDAVRIDVSGLESGDSVQVSYAHGPNSSVLHDHELA